MKDLIVTCDIISIHVPYNEETKNLISNQELSLFNNKENLEEISFRDCHIMTILQLRFV